MTSELTSESFGAILKTLRASDRFAVGRRILSVVALGVLAQDVDTAAWRLLRGRLHHDGMEDARAALLDLAERIEGQRPELTAVFSTVLVSDALHSRSLAETLTNAFRVMAELGFGRERAAFGRWFHDQLDEVASLGPAVGEVSTSRAMAHLLTSLAAIEPGQSVYDPCCGLGGLLGHAWLRHRDLELHGREVHPISWAFSTLRLHLLGARATVELGDSLARAPILADRVLCDPPFGPYPEHGNAAPSAFIPHAPGRRTYEALFVGHCTIAMKPGGRASVLVNGSFLARRGLDEELRRVLALEGLIEGIVSVPAGFVPWISADLAVLVLKEQAKRDPEIRMVDAARLPHTARTRSRLDTSQVNELLEAYVDHSGHAAAVTVSIRQVVEHGHYRPSQHFAPIHDRPALSKLLEDAKSFENKAAEEARIIDDLLGKLGLRHIDS